jgi:hypothetical protein
VAAIIEELVKYSLNIVKPRLEMSVVVVEPFEDWRNERVTNKFQGSISLLPILQANEDNGEVLQKNLVYKRISYPEGGKYEWKEELTEDDSYLTLTWKWTKGDPGMENMLTILNIVVQQDVRRITVATTFFGHLCSAFTCFAVDAVPNSGESCHLRRLLFKLGGREESGGNILLGMRVR